MRRFVAVAALALGCGRAATSHVTLNAVQPAPVPTVVTCPDGFAEIPGGRGLRPFCLEKTEVTAADYAACVARGRCSAKGLHCDEAATYDRADLANHPINCVDWSQATTYCAARGARLPTEGEWMWAAANGPDAAKHPWGEAPPSDDLLCFSAANKRAGTCAVRSYAPSRYGLYDMAGNVSEWTSSVTPELRGEEDAATPGGSWQYGPRWVATDVHYFSDIGVRDGTLGFRCAASGLPL